MKKNILLALCTIGLLASSCSKDEESTQEFSIVGIWSPSREIVVGSNGVTISNTAYTDCYKASTFDFKSDNKMTSHIYNTDGAGDCKNYGIVTVSYSYDHNAKKLIIDGEDVEIVSRTNNELQFVSDYDDVDGDGKDDKIVTVLVK
ncbi:MULTISPECIES: lipocalin family protein [Epilithonimonas]|nr:MULTISPECIES: lipocalin family protein [Epilithonimonas]RKE88391.1 lipocalin-like protein [Epilithonimonas arachidiradicis]UQB69548.1 lipocalin family protein [Epilithonimonas zeae]